MCNPFVHHNFCLFVWFENKTQSKFILTWNHHRSSCYSHSHNHLNRSARYPQQSWERRWSSSSYLYISSVGSRITYSSCQERRFQPSFSLPCKHCTLKLILWNHQRISCPSPISLHRSTSMTTYVRKEDIQKLDCTNNVIGIQNSLGQQGGDSVVIVDTLELYLLDGLLILTQKLYLEMIYEQSTNLPSVATPLNISSTSFLSLSSAIFWRRSFSAMGSSRGRSA